MHWWNNFGSRRRLLSGLSGWFCGPWVKVALSSTLRQRMLAPEASRSPCNRQDDVTKDSIMEAKMASELKAQASLCCIDSQKDRLFCTDRITRGMKLHSAAADGVPPSTGQARRCGALLGSHGRLSPQKGLQTTKTPQMMTGE